MRPSCCARRPWPSPGCRRAQRRSSTASWGCSLSSGVRWMSPWRCWTAGSRESAATPSIARRCSSIAASRTCRPAGSPLRGRTSRRRPATTRPSEARWNGRWLCTTPDTSRCWRATSSRPSTPWATRGARSRRHRPSMPRSATSTAPRCCATPVSPARRSRASSGSCRSSPRTGCGRRRARRSSTWRDRCSRTRPPRQRSPPRPRCGRSGRSAASGGRCAPTPCGCGRCSPSAIGTDAERRSSAVRGAGRRRRRHRRPRRRGSSAPTRPRCG